MYQKSQQSDAAQFSDAFQTPAPDGDPWSCKMSLSRMNKNNSILGIQYLLYVVEADAWAMLLRQTH